VSATSSTPQGAAAFGFIPAAGAREDRLEDFLAGEENRLARAAVAALVPPADATEQTAAEAFRLLVLHGPSGSGKTHLVRGLTRVWFDRRPDDVVVFFAGSEFAELFAAAVNEDRISPFRRRLRECDLLVIDDLSSLLNKPAAQLELQGTLDALERRGATIVVTLPTPPQRAESLSAAITARLSGGIDVGLAPPSTSTRRAILDRLTARYELNVADEALQALAADRARSVPEVCGLLLTLQHEAAVDGTIVDLPFVRRFLERTNERASPALKTIAERAARRFGLTLRDLKSDSRRRTVVAARDNAMLLARRLTSRSLQEIGEYFGNRDHTTVLHSCRKLEATLEHDSEARELFNGLDEELRRT
jgi:chromosomal replication initiator protein